MKVIAFTFNEGNGRRKIQCPSLIDCTEELPDDCICFQHKINEIEQHHRKAKGFQVLSDQSGI